MARQNTTAPNEDGWTPGRVPFLSRFAVRIIYQTGCKHCLCWRIALLERMHILVLNGYGAGPVVRFALKGSIYQQDGTALWDVSRSLHVYHDCARTSGKPKLGTQICFEWLGMMQHGMQV